MSGPNIHELEEAYKPFVAAEDWGIFRLGVRVVTARLCGGLAMRITGPSGCGKSTLAGLIAGVVPADERIQADSMTPKALFRMPRSADGVIDLDGKLIVRDEYEGGDRDDKLLRTLLAKGEATDQSVVGSRTIQYAVHGPISMVETSTASDANSDDDSRRIVVPITDSEERRSGMFELIRETMSPAFETKLQACRSAMERYQQNLPRDIDVYASVTTNAIELATPEQQRAMTARLIETAYKLVKANALLNYTRRPRDEYGHLVASTEDYREVRSLMAPYLTNSGTGVPMAVADLVRGVAQGLDRLPRNDPKRRGFTRRDIYEWNSTVRAHAERDLGRAVEEDLLLTVRAGGRGRRHLYTLAGDASTRISGVCPLPELPSDHLATTGISELRRRPRFIAPSAGLAHDARLLFRKLPPGVRRGPRSCGPRRPAGGAEGASSPRTSRRR